MALLVSAAACASPAFAADAAVEASPVATADAGAGGAVDELVVTARRREENVQNVPIAISVVGSQQLERTNTFSLEGVSQMVPSLQVFSTNARNTSVNIRGLGTSVALANDGLESGVGFYLDQVYYGRPAQAMFDLVDLDHIEVLRGPQGTLFGKNTTAGALNISSKAPSFTPDGLFEVDGGNYGFFQAKGTISGPIIADKLAFRLSASETHRSGFIDDVATGDHLNDYSNFAIRGQLLWTPTSNFRVRLIADWNNQQTNCCAQVLAGFVTQRADGTSLPKNFYTMSAALGYTPLPIDPFARKTDINSPVYARQKTGGVSGQADWDLGWATLTSVSAWRYWDWWPANDADYTGLSVLDKAQNSDKQNQFSQEIRLGSDGHHRIDYTVGGYFFWQDIKSHTQILYGKDATYWLFGPTLPGNLIDGYGLDGHGEPETKSYAAFGQAVWHITDKLSLTGGLRYTYEQKTGSFSQVASGGLDLSGLPPAQQAAYQALKNALGKTVTYTIDDNEGNLSGQANLAYQFTPEIMAYATYARGFKSGGLNLTTLPPGVSPVVKPEQIDSWETGVKTTLLDGRLVLNADAFLTEDKDYQTSVIDLTVSTANYIANIGKVRSAGVEVDARATPFEGLSIYASGTYDDATYADYHNGTCGLEYAGLKTVCDLTGQPVAGVPKWAASAGGEYDHVVGEGGLQGYFGGDVSWRSATFTAVSDSIYSRVGAYALVNARIGVRAPDAAWDVSVWAKNLFNKDYYQAIGSGIGNTGALFGLLGDPRTFGVTLRAKY